MTDKRIVQTNPWVLAATSLTPTPTVPPNEVNTLVNYVGAHGGAGTSLWARILGGQDLGTITHLPAPAGLRAVLVGRSSADGITAIKSAVHSYGVDAFTAVLVVPAAPTREPRLIANELKVLAGAMPLVRVPWLSQLLMKNLERVQSSDVPPKDLSKIHAGLNEAGVTIKGENP